MSALPALIGISIHEKKYYYLSWIPSESGPLVIDYGKVENKGFPIPLDYFVNKIKEYTISPQFSISLDNKCVKYNFLESYNSVIDKWNNTKNYDKIFKNCYDSYMYESKTGLFNIHILKTIKNSIIEEVKSKEYSLSNLSVGIFSALSGVRCWYNLQDTSNYIILKLCKRNILEILVINENQFSVYATGKKKNGIFNIINFFGNTKCKDSIIKIIESLFSDKSSLKGRYKVFYYSIDGSKEDVDFLMSLNNDNLVLINPFSKLKLDDNCSQKISNIGLSAYSELGSAFEGIDV